MPSYWEVVSTATAAYAMPGQPETTADFTGNGADGVSSNPAYLTGPHGFSFFFNGAQKVVCPPISPAGNAQRTVFCRHNAANGGFVWGQSSDGVSGGAFRFRARNSNPSQGLLEAPRIEFESGYSVGGGVISGWQSSAIVVPAGALQTSDVLLYANGVLQGLSDQLAAPVFDSASVDFTIGSDTRDLASERLVGEVAELIVFAAGLSAPEVTELHNGPEPTVLTPGQVALVGSQLTWSGWSWDTHENGLVTETYDVLKDGAVVAAGVTATSIDVTLFGAGEYSVLAKAFNNGGTSPQSEQPSTNSVAYSPVLTRRFHHVASDLHVAGFEATETKIAGEAIP